MRVRVRARAKPGAAAEAAGAGSSGVGEAIGKSREAIGKTSCSPSGPYAPG